MELSFLVRHYYKEEYYSCGFYNNVDILRASRLMYLQLQKSMLLNDPN